MESDHGKLFIGGISWDTDEERLKEYFSKYGEVMEAVIMRDRSTGRARGFGFVVFADPSVAERVTLEKHMIDGRAVEAKKAVPKDDQHVLSRNTSAIHGSFRPGRTKKIFVGGLASTVTESEFKRYFDEFGTITDVVVMYDHNTQRPRGFGFITFNSEEAVDCVLQKTFHEINGKMVEVKRAVPKEQSPGPTRSPVTGYNYGLSRASSFLNNYAQGYNMNSLGGYGVKMEVRFNLITGGRGGFSPLGTTNYGIDMNLDSTLSPRYGRNSDFGNSQVFAQTTSPYYNGNSNRYTTPIGYNAGNGRSDSPSSLTTRNNCGNGSLKGITNSVGPSSFLGTENGSFGVTFGNSGTNWSSSGYSTGIIGYGVGDSRFGSGGGGYGRNSDRGASTPSSVSATNAGYEGSYGEFYGSNLIFDDSNWLSPNPELDGSRSFNYGLGDIASDSAADKISEGYIGSCNVSSRQSNRGIAA